MKIHKVFKVNIRKMIKYNLLKLSFVCNFHNKTCHRISDSLPA